MDKLTREQVEEYRTSLGAAIALHEGFSREWYTERWDKVDALCDLALSALEREGWIPVRERLPEPGWRTVLFYDEDGVTYMGHHGENGWIDDANVDATYSLGVTHWMPLPAAPKG